MQSQVLNRLNIVPDKLILMHQITLTVKVEFGMDGCEVEISYVTSNVSYTYSQTYWTV